MAKCKEWHLRREQGIWRVYHRTPIVPIWGTELWLYDEGCVASSPDIHQAIRLGKHHAADVAMLEIEATLSRRE